MTVNGNNGEERGTMIFSLCHRAVDLILQKYRVSYVIRGFVLRVDMWNVKILALCFSTLNLQSSQIAVQINCNSVCVLLNQSLE